MNKLPTEAMRGLFILSVTWRPSGVRIGQRWVHGFASPPYDGFALSRMRATFSRGLIHKGEQGTIYHRLIFRLCQKIHGKEAIRGPGRLSRRLIAPWARKTSPTSKEVRVCRSVMVQPCAFCWPDAAGGMVGN